LQKDVDTYGDRHAHAVVNVGWDIKTDFPREQVARGFYANVDSRLRNIWKLLREAGEAHGFGRIELLPLKYSGAVCARYFTKYLTKSFCSNKLLGEEKCRLFSVWGGVRFAHPKFTFLSSRIVQKRKQWLAQVLELPDETHIAAALGPHWWFHFSKSLSEVILPRDFYRIGSADSRYFDELGLKEWRMATWPEEPSDDLMERSQFNLLHEIGLHLLGGDSGRAVRFASHLVAKGRTHESLSLPFEKIVLA
jgi:hypothetical protein